MRRAPPVNELKLASNAPRDPTLWTNPQGRKQNQTKLGKKIKFKKIELDGQHIEEIKVFENDDPSEIEIKFENSDLCCHQLRFHLAMMESSSGMGRAQLK